MVLFNWKLEGIKGYISFPRVIKQVLKTVVKDYPKILVTKAFLTVLIQYERAKKKTEVTQNKYL